MAQVYDKDLQKVLTVPVVYPAQAAAPTGVADQAHGYNVGDIWITAGVVYMCTANLPAGSAVWLSL